jgi:hypothetical protein
MTFRKKVSSEEEPRVWEEPELWSRAAASGIILPAESEAVTLGAGDPTVAVNHHDLRLAQQKVLHGDGEFSFGEVRSDFDFSSLDFWDGEQQFLLNTYRSVYPADEEAVGWTSLTSIRRPATLRSLDDPDILVEELTTDIDEICKLTKLPQTLLLLGRHLRVSGAGLRLACKEASEEARGKHSVFRVIVRRRVRSPKYGLDCVYHEVWFCLGRRGEDEERLQRRQIPAIPEHYYQGQAVRVRTTPILTLCKVTRSLWYSMVGLEIHPGSGEILSIRSSEMPLIAALLAGAKVEQAGIRNAFRKLGA